MSESNKEALGNLNSMGELDRTKFRNLATEIKDSKRKADELLYRIKCLRDELSVIPEQSEAAVTHKDDTGLSEVPETKIAEASIAETDVVIAQTEKEEVEAVETVVEIVQNEPQVITEESTAENKQVDNEEKLVIDESMIEKKITKTEENAGNEMVKEKPVENKNEKKAEAPVAVVAKNPLRPDVPEPRKFVTKVYIPESERGIGRQANRPDFPRTDRRPPYNNGAPGTYGGYNNNWNGNRNGNGNGVGYNNSASRILPSDKEKPLFVPPVGGFAAKNTKPAKKNFDKAPEDRRTSKRSILRKELENGAEIDDAEIARRYKSKRYQKQSLPPQSIIIEKAVITIDPVPIKMLSEKIGKPSAEIIKKLILEGILKNINDSIPFATAELIAADYGIELELKPDKTAEDKLAELMENLDTAVGNKRRAPIITIMGHVDHGKTSLLDYIRHANVADKEAGGITQHIGAYTIEKNGGTLTFIDTPGHEAFTTMRARGAMVTDIVVIVVAADDGIMPQSVEAINHAKAAKVPIIIAINKIDKVGADTERIKVDLSNNGLIVEEWGGDVMCVPVSAKTGQGVDQLLDGIMLMAECCNLEANPDSAAKGTIIEARLDKGSGPVATILVQNGTLKVGDFMVAGAMSGRVKSMLNDKGKLVKEAGPSMPVAVLGFDEVPKAGDKMVVIADEKWARKVTDERRDKIVKIDDDDSKPVNIEDLIQQISEGKLKELNLVIKADVQGSVEALAQEMIKLSNDEVKVHIVHRGVGAINESDVALASTSGAIMIGFNVRPDNNAKSAASKYNVDIRNYRIIYDVINDITDALNGMLSPKYKENYIGKAEVRDIFHINGVGTVAGCRVVDGKLERSSAIRLLRDNIVIHEGKIDSLKRLKDDAKEVASGFECGVSIVGYNDIKVGDVIECFTMEQVK